MNIISIGSDRNIFIDGSIVRERIIKYGDLCNTLHVIVFTKKDLKFTKTQIAKNVFLYPTNSSSKLKYMYDAIKIGGNITGINLITTQDPFETGIVGVELARKLKARLEIQIHTDFLSKYFKKWDIKNVFRVFLGKYVLKKADCIRVVSNRIKTSIKVALPHISVTPIVLPVFIDFNKIKDTLISVDLHKEYPQFDHISLMVSRLEKEKDIKRVIKIFSKIVRNYPKSGLVIVGDGSQRKSLESAVNALKLTENVIFEGWQEDIVKLVSYYKSADLFLNTSLYEGYGRTLVEALASGTLVLSTDVGVATEIGSDIFRTDEELYKKVVGYIDGKEGNVRLKTYPYRNEEEYLLTMKDGWNRCSRCN